MDSLVRDILMWAAGSAEPAPEVAVVCESELLEAVKAHKLEGRLLHLAIHRRPDWCSQALMKHLAFLQIRAEAHTRRQLRALSAVVSGLANERELVVVKGFATYALTGRSHNIHYSGDVDVLTSDMIHLREILLDLGYYEEGGVAVHEFAKMHRDETMIDIHRYFPILTYANPEIADTMIPSDNPGCWIQTDELGAHHAAVRYDDILKHSMYGLTPETSELLVPQPHMFALVLCAHLFIDAEKQDHIRLVDMADLCDMTQHSLFSQEEFLTLVAEFDARHAVAFAGDLISSSFGYNPLPNPRCNSRGKGVGRRLNRLICAPRTVFGCEWFCAVIEQSIDELLTPGRDVRAIVDQLGANMISARSDQPKVYSVLMDGDSESLQRAIVKDCRGRRLPVQFSVVWTEQALCFEVFLPETPEGYLDWVAVGLSREYRCIAACDGQKADLMWDSVGDVSVAGRDDGYVMALLFPWAELPTLSAQDDAMSVILACDRKRENDEALWAATLLPLCIRREK